MADADRILKILLQLGVVGQEQITAAFKQIEAQAAETAATVKQISAGQWTGSSGQKITDANVPPVSPELAQAQAYEAERAAIAAQETGYANQYAAEWIAAGKARADAQSLVVVKTEEQLAAEAKIAAQQAAINLAAERRVIMETQIEAAEARIAGNTALAANLEREADIRTRSLSIQRSLNVSTEESIVLAERLVAAEEATAAPTALAGINIGKARQESTVLARELATGNVRASTLGSLLGSLGPAITIAALAAYELYKAITDVYEQEVKAQEVIGGMFEGLRKSGAEWDKMAKRAQSLGDQIHLADKIDIELAKLEEKLAEFRAKDISGWGRWVDTISHMLGSAIPGHGPRPYQDAADQEMKAAQEAIANAAQRSNQAITESERRTVEWVKATQNLPEGIRSYTAEVSRLQAKLDQLDVARRLNPRDANLVEQWHATADQLEFAKGSLEKLTQEQERFNKGSREGTAARREFSALLKDEANELQAILIQQQLISKDPFLSVNSKQAALAATSRQEMASLNREIERQKSYVKNTALDPVQLEQAKQKLQQMIGRAAELKMEIASMSTFGGQLRAELAKWGNSFGTTAHQIGGAIQGSINASLQQMNQWILTGKFNLKDLLSSFAQIGLTLVEQFAIQEALKLAGITTSTTEAATAGPSVAASWATAATMVSVATEGQADLTGAAGLAAAVAFGQSLTAAKDGMYIDRGTHSTADDVLVRVSKGEGIINARAVESQGGRSWVDSINSNVSRPRFGVGGMIGGGDGSSSDGSSTDGNYSRRNGPYINPKDLKIEVYNFTDVAEMNKKWVESNAGRKVLNIHGSRQRWGS